MRSYDAALKKLSAWFEKNQRILPWRDEPTLYRVWVSEIMLAQTQVITVIPFFEKFIARFPDLATLAQSNDDEVMKYWAGLGYYSRARNLLKTAKLSFAAGGLPTSVEAWLEMPGVGPYTAGAITSIALNQPNAILDGNVDRVLARVHRVNRKGSEASHDREYKERLWELSRMHVDRAHRVKIDPRNFNQALMELGATVCKPKNPDCANCPLAKSCEAHEAGETDLYPPKRKRAKFIDITEEVVALVSDESSVLLEKMGEGSWRKGLWDFPVRERLARNALSRMREWANVNTRHVVTHHKILRTCSIFKVSPRDMGRMKLARDQAWVKISDLEAGSVAHGSALKKSLKEVLRAIE